VRHISKEADGEWNDQNVLDFPLLPRGCSNKLAIVVDEGKVFDLDAIPNIVALCT